MHKEACTYILHINYPNVEVRLNGAPLFNTTLKRSGFFKEAYWMRNPFTTQRCKLTCFKKTAWYYGEEKLHLCDEEGEVVLKLNFTNQPMLVVTETNKQIELSAPEKNQLFYKEADINLTGEYHRVPFFREITFSFESPAVLEAPFNLLVCCLSYKMITDPQFW